MHAETLRHIDGLIEDKKDVNKFYKAFIDTPVTSHVSVDDNANVTDNSILSFYNEAPKAAFKEAALEYIKNHIGEKHLKLINEGTLYVNDLSNWWSPYCYAFDSANVVNEGLPFSKPLRVNPPRHSSTFINLTIQATFTISNSIAGAVSWPSLFIYFDWYLRKEYGDNYTELADYSDEYSTIEQLFQELVFGFNYNFRVSQSAFVNLSIYDKYFLEDMYSNTVYPDGTKADLGSIDRLQRWFCTWFVNYNTKKQPLTFPVLTAAMYAKDGEIVDKDFLYFISKLNTERGTFNIYAGELGKLSSCCRLRNDTSIFTNMLGTPSVSVGSTRVVALNLLDIALGSINKDDFINRLTAYHTYAKDILVGHRKMLESAIHAGKHPLYTYGWIDTKRQFLTVGFVGIAEAIEVLKANDIYEASYVELATAILDVLNGLNGRATKETGYNFNLEQIPAESAAVKLAMKTNLKYGTNYEILSNQFVPLSDEVDIFDRIDTHGQLDSLTHGGGILHLNISERIESPTIMQRLIEHCVAKGVIYFAVNYGISQCTKCGKTVVGILEESICCKAPIVIWERIVGFLRSRDSWSKARQIEGAKRVRYKSYENCTH